MRFIKWVIKSSIFLFCCFFIILTGLYTYAYLSPKLDLKTSGSLYIYDNNEELIYQGSSTHEWVNIEDISQDLINAVISIEDKNFYNHKGFDYLRIAKAMYLNIKNRDIIQGASTISQQYIKNLYLDFDQNWHRKIEEAFLTLELEVHYEKNDILEGYLNTINYGQGNYGIVNAASYYFNKKVSELTLEEATMLAGIPKNPSNYNPVSNYNKCIERAKIVAKSMVNNKYITNEEYNNLFKSDVEIYGKRKDNNLQMLMYFQEAVLEELNNINTIPKSFIESGGLKIYTTLDLETQQQLEENILNNKVDDEHQIASVVVKPKSGAVLALTGGMNYAESQFNRALKSKRQVGSTMKTFLYYAALENNLTMASTFTSEPTTFNLSNGKIYAPTNAGDLYANKNITMATAVAYSDNIYAVKTNLFLGIDKMIEVANRSGIKTDFEEIASLPLGTNEINIIDYATGYNTFATGGYKKELYFIEKIEDLNGLVLYEKKQENTLVLNPNYTYILNEMLANTTNANFVDYNTPTALTIASKLSHKFAIKTGTTNTDYWIVGYNEDVLMATWMGYDNNESVTSKIRNAAKNIWAETVEDVLKEQESTWYKTPKNVVAIPLHAITGSATNTKNKAAMYYFVKGSEPNFTPEQYVLATENKENE
ncbi:MAG: PBP1A family penicillin-binding protein [Firmicutes bacterium]|nr:PBP1A family penicillin-binding protein [Bacillota bacterium]